MQVIRSLLPRKFEWALYKAEATEPAGTSDLVIQVVGPKQQLKAAERAFLREHKSRFNLWWLLRWHRRGKGWVFFAICDGQFSHFTFVTPVRQYRKIFAITQPSALLIGPCFTAADFRGRSIYPRVLRHVVCALSAQGYGPFYIHTDPSNIASVRGIEKAGFSRCGIWAGTRALLDLKVSSHRIDDKCSQTTEELNIC